jgi:hypothetical protein
MERSHLPASMNWEVEVRGVVAVGPWSIIIGLLAVMYKSEHLFIYLLRLTYATKFARICYWVDASALVATLSFVTPPIEV